MEANFIIKAPELDDFFSEQAENFVGLAAVLGLDIRTDFVGASLRGIGAPGAALEGANFNRADLSGAILAGARLSFSNLSQADLSRANLAGADVTRANLRGACLRGADLSRCTLAYSDLTEADLTDAVGSDVDLTGTILGSVTLPPGLQPSGREPDVFTVIEEIRAVRLELSELADGLRELRKTSRALSDLSPAFSRLKQEVLSAHAGFEALSGQNREQIQAQLRAVGQLADAFSEVPEALSDVGAELSTTHGQFAKLANEMHLLRQEAEGATAGLRQLTAREAASRSVRLGEAQMDELVVTSTQQVELLQSLVNRPSLGSILTMSVRRIFLSLVRFPRKR